MKQFKLPSEQIELLYHLKLKGIATVQQLNKLNNSDEFTTQIHRWILGLVSCPFKNYKQSIRWMHFIGCQRIIIAESGTSSWSGFGVVFSSEIDLETHCVCLCVLFQSIRAYFENIRSELASDLWDQAHG